MKTRVPLKTAKPLADKIVHVLADYCDRISIAGSLRRCTDPNVFTGDIDIVVQTKSDLQWSNLIERCEQNTVLMRQGARMARFAVTLNSTHEIGLEIWRATAGGDELFSTQSNWGSILLCRTGNADFTTSIAARAKKMGTPWVIQKGLVRPLTSIKDYELAVKNGEPIAGKTEEEIFEALEMPYIEPEKRDKYYAD